MSSPDRNQPCQTVQACLGDYLEGILETGARTSLESHLESCAACRRALESERRLWTLLADMEREPAPAGFSDRIMGAIFPSPASWRHVREADAHPSIWSRFALAGAVMLLALILGQWLQPGQSGQTGPERLRDTAALALLEGGRELSGTLQLMEKAGDSVRQVTHPTLLKVRSIVGMERVLRNALPVSALVLFCLVGLTPLVFVFTVYRLRIKGAISNVLAFPAPH